MNNPLVSVLIPAYNHENYVQDTIQSIINQKYQNIELIVLDDGSSDSTFDKINELKEACEKRFSNVIFRRKVNEGICETLNKLIELSSGEYVFMIASDDMAKPNAISEEIDFLEKNKEYSLCVGNNEFIDSEGKICYWKNDAHETTYNPDKAQYKTFYDAIKPQKEEDFGKYSSLYIKNHVPNGCLIRKSVFEKICMFTDEAPLEDWFLMLQIAKFSKMKYIDKILFSYRWHGTNTVKNKEKMLSYVDKTISFEEKIIKQADKDFIFPEVFDIIKNGVTYKKQGIPFVFEIVKIKKSSKKIRQIKLFNIKIFEYDK